ARPLPDKVRRRAGAGAGRGPLVVRETVGRQLPHGVVRTPRRPDRAGGSDPARRGRRRQGGVMGPTSTARVQPIRCGGRLTRELAGGKAWGIQHMLTLGIPVPPAFVLTTEVCRAYHADGRKLPPAVLDEMRAAMVHLEDATGRQFGRTE